MRCSARSHGFINIATITRLSGGRLVILKACYVVYNGEAVVVNAMEQTRREIEFVINELKP